MAPKKNTMKQGVYFILAIFFSTVIAGCVDKVELPKDDFYEESEELLCVKCGSDDLHPRGWAYTKTGKYRRYRCSSCGGWNRGRFSEYPKDKRTSLLTNAV